MAATALALSACQSPGSGSDDNGGDDEGLSQDTAVTFGWNQSFYEYNGDSSTGNATANAIVLYLMNSAFRYFDEDLNIAQDTSFGTYEKTSDDPLTVEYTVNDDVAWSDGTPVDAADMLLSWAATSGHFNTLADEEVETDEEGNVTNQGDNVYFSGTSVASSYIIPTPEISEDGKTITLVYDRPFADWEQGFGIGVPAHVVAMHALGIDDATEAKEALIDAINNDDTEALAAISQFWNEGFQFGDSLPDDESLYLSNGAYLLTDFVRDQYVTLERNPDYNGDRPANVERVTIRYNGDPMASLQALQNGEVDVIEPQATTDILQAAEALGEDFTVLTGDAATYEHIDLAQNNGGPFDPAAYGGDAAIARDVREAFLLLIPREDIVDTLIRPLNPEANVRQTNLAVPSAPNYDAIVAANGYEEAFPAVVDQSSIDRATQLLTDAGVTTPIDVRIMTDSLNTRRQNQLQIISDTVNASGLFSIVDASNADWGALLSDTSQYDAAIFGWQSTGTGATNSDANYRPGAINNFYGYDNPEVTALLDEIAVTTDQDTVTELQGEMEAFLVQDAFGLPIYQHPGVDVYRNSIEGINPIALSPTVFWNYWEWDVTGDTAGEPTSEEATEEATE
ncbi:ABC transporter family substrate-binding protein [Beutenbergia cavernae]|uniref:ABC transporter family substrate-binding protein n=1 Tax=Beutenbergia cavernae TaxID=84757 RepID=UPI00019AD1D8|nr:ABC transporter family substrate-binding protein [Beutenbergia cavernae]